METTTIQVSRKLRTKLSKMKYDLNLKSIDEVIQRLYDIVSKFKMAGELKEGGK